MFNYMVKYIEKGLEENIPQTNDSGYLWGAELEEEIFHCLSYMFTHG